MNFILKTGSFKVLSNNYVLVEILEKLIFFEFYKVFIGQKYQGFCLILPGYEEFPLLTTKNILDVVTHWQFNGLN